MVSIQAASLKRRARERRNRLQRQNKKQLRDLGKAESNAAMQQAAQLLLRRLHGKRIKKRDPNRRKGATGKRGGATGIYSRGKPIPY